MTKQKILIVDDKPANLFVLEQNLKDIDAEIISATSGNAALALTLHNDFALAILDVQMPIMDGFELAEMMRGAGKTADIPIIFMSAVFQDNYHIFKGYEAGAVDFLIKPYEPIVLRSKVRIFLKMNTQQEMLLQVVKELKIANTELESFSYSVSHDLQAPLRSIDGFSKILLEDHFEGLSDQANDYLRRVREGAQRMGYLIDDMLILSRISRSQLEGLMRVSLDTILPKIIEAACKDLSLDPATVEFEPGLHLVADPHLIESVFVNLITNALKYSSKVKVPQIKIGQKETSKGRLIFVQDNGVGFDASYLDKLFVPFYRHHSEQDFDGIGIGLAIVKRVIDKHDGEIWAESTVGNGATFYFTLSKGIKS